MKNGLIAGITAVLIALLPAQGCRVKEEAPPSPAELVSITLRPSSPGIAPGTTLQLEAIGNYSNDSTSNLTNSATWESADTAVAAVSGTGLAAAANVGATTITARSGLVSGSTVVTVSPLASLALTPADQTIAAGTSQQYTAIGTLQNGAAQDLTSFVTWTSSDAAIAAVSVSGLATTVVSTTGQATITASLGAITKTATLTTDAVASIAVTPPTARIALGTSRQFTATGTLAGGQTQNLTSFTLWSSSTPSVATIGNTAGTFGLAESKGTGTTDIIASFGTATSPPAALTVTSATLVSLAVAPTSTGIPVGLQQQFTAAGTFSDGTTQDLTESAAWASSNAQIATVSNAPGARGSVSGLAQGTATIAATLSGVTSNRALVTVTAPVLVSIAITPSNSIVPVSISSVQFNALGLISDGTSTNLTAAAAWQSSNQSVALISDAGFSKGFASLLNAGTTTITATSGAVTGSTVLTVTF